MAVGFLTAHGGRRLRNTGALRPPFSGKSGDGKRGRGGD